MCFFITNATMTVDEAIFRLKDNWLEPIPLPHETIERALEALDEDRMDNLTMRLFQTINGMKPIILGG